jgi:hypothetical protein
MRLTCYFVVGITAFGCKDKQPTKGAEQTSQGATPGSSPAPKLAPAAPAPPALDPGTNQLDQAFATESVDSAWAAMAEKSIHAVAPQLTDVTCKQMQCRVTLTAASEEEIMTAADKLQGEDSLRGIDGAQAVLLTRPEPRDGKLAMTIYVRFDRE